ncbi:hypothetical protein B0H10DRAFT_1939676 [Mycena sp. CBHHK59/15]|nr:hypothetical protein B0H10DRAFT_1939676 [Mycena sp. CBHHK59/15]
MEMPGLKPGLKTRDKNKNTRPGVNAGVEKRTRRTAVQMQQARSDETTSKAKAALDQKKKEKQLAALEDKQQQDDLAYAKTANHPPDRPLKSSAPVVEAVAGGAAGGGAGGDPGSGHDSDPYDPESEESSEESESEPDDNDEDDVPKKKKKKQVTSRADIIAARHTQDPPGTPAVAVAEDNRKKRKSKDKDVKKARKKAKLTKKKSGLEKSKSLGDRGAPAAPGADDDSMVAPGGPAVDDDPDEHVERPKTGKKKKGIPTTPLIAIQVVAPRPPTRREQRGGTNKWTLKHLPAGTSSEFTDEVVPLARELVGTLAPWVGLTVKKIQDIVDRVYGEGKHEVAPDSAWVGLIGYRLSDWRSGIATQAIKAIDALIDTYEDDSDDDIEAGSNDIEAGSDPSVIPPAADAAPAVAEDAVAPAGAPKALKFAFNTPEGIAAFIKWALQSHAESGTMAFHWKTWGNGVDKKGFLQSHLIVYTFAYHLACLAAIPGGYPRLDSPPIGALLLSAQAVHRALQFWQTGEYVNPQKTSSHFSIDNWGDTVINATGHVEKRGKLVRRATKFFGSLQKWDEARWKELKAAAAQWV